MTIKEFFSKYKKTILIPLCIVAVLGAIGTGAVFAMDSFGDNNNTNNNTSTNTNDSNNVAKNKQNTITDTQAKEIALKDAGVDASKVSFIKADIDREDGALVYDVEFIASSMKYEYEINATTGEILERNMEAAPVKNQQTSNDIGINQAKNIAATHAGFTVNDVNFTQAKIGNENGRIEYEIEFYKDGVEYDYEINAADGKIISYESNTVKK